MKITDIIGNDLGTSTKTIKVNKKPIVIRKRVDAEVYAGIVRTWIELKFNKKGVYQPEFDEITRRYIIVNFFTDIDITDVSINELFKMTQIGSWFSEVESEVINNSIWYAIEDSVAEGLRYRLSKEETNFDKLCAEIKEAVVELKKPADLTEIKQVLSQLHKVDKSEFIETVIENNLAKKKKADDKNDN